MSDYSSESDMFADNTDSDPDYIPGSDLDISSNNITLLSGQSKNQYIHSNVVDQLNNTDIIGNDNCKSAVLDFEVRPRPDEPVVGRKRKRNADTWKRAHHNKNRLSGKEYKTRSGHTVAAKLFSDKQCKCSRKCNEKVSTEERETLFKSFYGLNNQTQQNIFLNGCIKSCSIARRRPTNESKPPRTHSFSFFLRVKNNDIRVCKTYFRQTFQVSDGRIHSCCTKDGVSGIVDRRGKSTPGNKLDITDVVNHINSFPAYFSHYTRTHNPNRKYLNPDLTIKKMYDMYVLWCTDNQKTPVKEKMYYHVFSTKFNLHFKPPLKDTCQVCDGFKNRLLMANEDDRKVIETEKELHLRKAENARNSLKEDQRACSDDLYVLTFDFQKALAFPKLSTSVAYYKRNLYVYDFGVHVFNDNKAYMYVWPETEGSRGAQEISSCLSKHLTIHGKNAKHVIMYSDSCGGQNRNIKVVLSLMKYLQNENVNTETIDLKFLVPGHSYLPNDSDFSFIEKKQNLLPTFSHRGIGMILFLAAGKQTNIC